MAGRKRKRVFEGLGGFDTAKFISEIQKRSYIWNRFCATTKADDIAKKSAQWREVVDLYCRDNTSSSTKQDMCRMLKQKWRNIRDCFVKVHKSRMMNEEPGKRKEYLYYENLLFLADETAPCVPQKTVEEDQQNIDEDSNSQTKVWIPRSISERNESNDSNAVLSTYSSGVRKLHDDSIKDPISEEQSTWPIKIFKTSTETDRTTGGKLDNILEMDDSTLFFLSLVKEFRKIPEEDQLQTKLDILQLIQSAQGNR